MQREVKQHLIYSTILFVIVFGMLFYQNTVNTETTNQLITLQSSLQETQTALEAEIATLQEKDASLETNVEGLSTSLEKKDEEIKLLTGEIADVRVQSAEQVQELEDSVSNLKLQNQDFSDVIDDVIPAVVSIRTDKSTGSGFIIDASEGIIVTNHHVISGARAAVVETSDGRKHGVSLVGSNSQADLAVIKITADGLTRIRFGDSDDVKVGEKVIAVGSPGGLDFSVTQGIVSNAMRRDKGRDLIQIDVPINPGNSGGPLINAAGRVIGVNTQKVEGFEGVGFALASNYVDEIVDEIREG